MHKIIAVVTAFSMAVGPLSTVKAAEEVTVTWNVDGEKSSDTVPLGSTVDVGKTAYKEGWTFHGWTSSPESDEIYTDYFADRDVELYALFSKDVTAKFYGNDGCLEKTATAWSCSGWKAYFEVPEITEKEGWEINGYTLSKDPSDEIFCRPGDTISISESTDLYSSYRNEKSINFHCGESVVNKIIDLYCGAVTEENSVKVTAPTEDDIGLKEGWRLAGWSVTDSGFDIDLQPDGGIDGETSDYYLISAKDVSLKFDCTGTMEGSVITNCRGEQKPAEFKLPEVSKKGHVLTGWKINGNIYKPGSVFTATEDAAAEAVWESNVYIIDYDGNGSTSGTMDSVSAKWDTDVTLTKNMYSRRFQVKLDADGGYCSDSLLTAKSIFCGWALSKDGTEIYKDGETVQNLTSDYAVTLFAVWEDAKLELPIPEKSGYTFGGWVADNKIYKGTVTVSKDLDLKASWTPVGTTTTIKTCGGTNAENISIDTKFGENMPAVSPAPERVYAITLDYGDKKPKETLTCAYKLDGIYSKENGAGTKYYDSELKSCESWKYMTGQTLYANWVPSNVTLPTPEFQQYSFAGWNDGIKNWTGSYIPTGNVTLKVDLTPKKYSFSLDLSGGIIDSEHDEDQTALRTGYQYGESFTLPKALKDGASFLGWFDKDGKEWSAITAETFGDISLSAKWKDLSSETFAGDTSITKIVIPDGTEEIADGYFTGCTSLETITLPESIKTIGADAFSGCTNLKAVTIPSGVEKIADSVFAGCTNLTSVNLNSNLQSIGSSAFSGCIKLTKINIPLYVRTIGTNAFSGCESLASVKIGGDVINIGQGAFKGCRSLSEVIIPESVEEIGDRAFEGCSVLQKVTIKNPSCIIGDDVFATGCILMGYNPSTAQEWAEKNGLQFSSLGESYVLTVYLDAEKAKAYTSIISSSGTLPAEIAIPENVGGSETEIFKGFVLDADYSDLKKGDLLYDSNGYCIADCAVIGDMELVPLWEVMDLNDSDLPDNTSTSGKEPAKTTTKNKVSKKWIGKVRYSLSGNSAKVIKLKSSSAIVIPAFVKSSGKKYKVTTLASGSCSGCRKIKKITIKSKTLKAGKKSFKGLKKGTKLIVPKTVVKNYKKLVNSLGLRIAGK